MIMKTKNYIVALKKGVDFDQFWKEMESRTKDLDHVPDRAVAIADNRNVFQRICQYELTDAEAELLRQDSRVAGVELPVKDRKDIVVMPRAVANENFTKPTGTATAESSGGDNVNWGLIRHNNSTNVYGTELITDLNYWYGLDGSGVDIIITDSGVQADHPEFQYTDYLASRVQQIDWSEYVPALATMSDPYEDPDGHGTQVCGIAAGKTYGWAKNSLIYSLVVTGPGAADPIDMFDAIKQWHESKGANGRPTVVNMSWGIVIPYDDFGPDPVTATDNFLANVTSVTYRGVTYPGNVNVTNYGLLLDSSNLDCVNSLANGFPIRYSPYDVALEELIDSGVVVVKAAGNNSYKIDVPTGPDYDNYVTAYSVDLAYQQGDSPWAADMITVGSLDAIVYSNALDQKVSYSCAGPGVDVYAAGTNILSAGTSNTSADTYAISNVYFKDNNFRQLNISGTSMASPQVTGIASLYLQNSRPANNLNSNNCSQVKSWITSVSTETMYAPGNTTSYTNFASTLGGNAVVAFQPLQQSPESVEVYLGGIRQSSGYNIINLNPVTVEFDTPPPSGVEVTILVRRGTWWYDIATPAEREQSLQETANGAARFLRGQ